MTASMTPTSKTTSDPFFHPSRSLFSDIDSMIQLRRLALIALLGSAGSLFADTTIPEGAVLRMAFDDHQILWRKENGLALTAGKSAIIGQIQSAGETRGVSGKALVFVNDENSILDLGRPSALRSARSVSVSAWVRVQRLGSSNYIVSQEDWNRGIRGFVLRIDSKGRPDFTVGSQGWVTAEGPPLPEKKWVHLAGTVDDVELVLYIDGETVQATDSRGGVVPSIFGLTVGRGNFDRKRGYDGAIDEVAIYDRALTPQEVQTLYRLGKGKKSVQPEPGEASTHLAWPLEQEEKVAPAANLLALAPSPTSGEAALLVGRGGKLAFYQVERREVKGPVEIESPGNGQEVLFHTREIALAPDARKRFQLLARSHDLTLHTTLNARGKLEKSWDPVHPKLELVSIDRMPTLTTLGNGKLGLLALGRDTEGVERIASAGFLSRDLLRGRGEPTRRVARFRDGKTARSLPVVGPEGDLLLLTDYGPHLYWIPDHEAERVPCLEDVRERGLADHVYRFQAGRDGRGWIVAQVTRGLVTRGQFTQSRVTRGQLTLKKRSTETCRLSVATGPVGGLFRKIGLLDFPFPIDGGFTLVTTPDDRVILLTARIDVESALIEPYRIEAWELTSTEVRPLGLLGLTLTASHLEAAIVSRDRLAVAVGGLEGVWTISWQVPPAK